MNDVKRKTIRPLPEFLAHRIAAGEVVERPASALKELIENALDAHATRISVEADEGGIALLRIADNGEGMTYDDLPLALAHHATSKIASVEDLSAIRTFGFRGEALASIADVAQVEIVSKRADEDGARIVVEGGTRKAHAPFPAANGTAITIRNLFYNLPARKKFLKHPSRELIALKETVERMALTRPETAFLFSHNGKESMRFEAYATLEERLRAYFGAAIWKRFRTVSADADAFSVRAYVSFPDLTDATTRNIRLFINGRAVENKTINYAAKLAYDTLIPKARFPYAYVYIDADPSRVDVNVHPSKREVKLKDERMIARALTDAIRTAFVPQTQRSAFSIAERRSDPIETQTLPFASYETFAPEPLSGTVVETTEDADDDRARVAPNETPRKPAAHLRALGVLFGTYLVAEIGTDVVFIDFYAAYTRVNFERMKRAMGNGDIVYEELIAPIDLEFSSKDAEKLRVGKERLRALGIAYDFATPTTIVIERVPKIFKGERSGDAMKDMIDAYLHLEGKFDSQTFLNAALTASARAMSPKANTPLSHRDMQTLLETLHYENMLTTAPSGRPFMLRIEKDYIDKKLFRT